MSNVVQQQQRQHQLTSNGNGIEQQFQELRVNGQQEQQHRRRPLMTPDPKQRRPFDKLGRPPCDAIPPGRPQFQRGRRHDVVCYNPATGSHEVLRNALLRDYSRSSGMERGTGNNNRNRDRDVQQYAYYPTPYKHPIKTIMGHVEICIVLERCPRSSSQHNENDDGNLSTSSSTSSNDDDEDEEDVVFQWTDKKVAVKVNSCATMERLQNKHAEDPWKEIAIMQLIGNHHENVLGCIEVLFDGHNLNVVMDYCDSGDLFQLLQDVQGSNVANNATADGPPGMTEGQARYWFRQIIKGVQYLHEECGICHRDLSPENVMIDKHKRGVVIDMGMCLRVPYQIIQLNVSTSDNEHNKTTARLLQVTDLQSACSAGATPLTDSTSPVINDNTNNNTTLRRRRCLFNTQGACGKLPYMSPEIYRNRDPFDGEAADIWTAGTILFCMVTGNRSYSRPHISDPQFYWMTMGLEQLLVDWHVNLSPEGVHLLKNMLQVDPRIRLTLQEVVNHPWFDYPDEEPISNPTDEYGGMEFDLDDDI